MSLRRLAVSGLALVLLAAPGWSAAEEARDGGLSPAARERKAARYKPSGKVSFVATNVALGVGVTWGSGQLEFEGETHELSISGLGLVGIGGARLRAEGTVFNLEKLEDFAGTYVAVESGAAAGPLGGSAGLTMRKGDVFVTLESSQSGAKLAVGPSGITFGLE